MTVAVVATIGMFALLITAVICVTVVYLRDRDR